MHSPYRARVRAALRRLLARRRFANACRWAKQHAGATALHMPFSAQMRPYCSNVSAATGVRAAMASKQQQAPTALSENFSLNLSSELPIDIDSRNYWPFSLPETAASASHADQSTTSNQMPLRPQFGQAIGVSSHTRRSPQM